MKPKVFIGSSVEGLEVAYSIQQNLHHEVEGTVWAQGIFELSRNTMESLSDALNSVDFGVFIFTPDDVVTMRGNQASIVRDNVLFELGLFIGKLGRNRVFFIIPEGNNIQLPTDLLGITPGKYTTDRSDNNLAAATGAACNQIRIQIKKLGLLNPADSSKNSSNPAGKDESTHDDWSIDIENKNYSAALAKLEKLLPSRKGINHTIISAWVAYTNFRLEKHNAKQKLIEIFNSNIEIPAISSLIPKMFLWAEHSELATELATKANEKCPKNLQCVETLVYCYEEEGSDQDAIELIENSGLQHSPYLAPKFSELLKQSGDNLGALKALHTAYRTNSRDNIITYELALSFLDLGYKKEALSLFHTLTERDELDSSYWGYLSNACLDLELYDKAMACCKKANNLTNSSEAWIVFNIGNMLNNKGLYSDAIDWLKLGATLVDEDQYGYDRLAKAMKSKEDEQKKFDLLLKEGRGLVKKFGL